MVAAARRVAPPYPHRRNNSITPSTSPLYTAAAAKRQTGYGGQTSGRQRVANTTGEGRKHVVDATQCSRPPGTRGTLFDHVHYVTRCSCNRRRHTIYSCDMLYTIVAVGTRARAANVSNCALFFCF